MRDQEEVKGRDAICSYRLYRDFSTQVVMLLRVSTRAMRGVQVPFISCSFSPSACYVLKIWWESQKNIREVSQRCIGRKGFV